MPWRRHRYVSATSGVTSPRGCTTNSVGSPRTTFTTSKSSPTAASPTRAIQKTVERGEVFGVQCLQARKTFLMFGRGHCGGTLVV